MRQSGTMGYLFYNVLLLVAAPVILIALLAKKRCRRGLLQRLGLAPYSVPGDGRPVIWIHAVSLGEVVAIVPFVQALHARSPGWRIVISTVTDTGREAVEQRLEKIATHCYAPLDFPWVVNRALDRLQPSLFLFVETELWPNVLRALSQRGIPAILINGRLSSRSFRGYLWLRPFFAGVLRHVTLLLAQSERDQARFQALGVEEGCVIRTGNLKFDQLPQAGPGAVPDRVSLGLSDNEQLLVAGSTHPVEEEHVLDCYRTLSRTYPALVLVLAPRHIERAEAVVATVRRAGLPVIRRSELAQTPAGGGPRVLVLDTRGELASLYRHALVAFVGGTLVPVGGHNLLEPAVWGRPVLFGPYTDHCAELADLLLQAGGAARVADGHELRRHIERLLTDGRALDTMGAAARRVVVENRGAVQRTLDLLAPFLAARRDAAGGARMPPQRVPQENTR